LASNGSQGTLQRPGTLSHTWGSEFHSLRSIVAVLMILLAACGAPPARPPAATSPAVAGAAAATPQGAAAYHIDSSRSELRVLVYRGGVAAALGHNHVMVNRSLQGWVRFDGSVPHSGFYLTLPANGFVVDEEGTRVEEGAEFSEQISADARAGTYRNMLSPAVLDAQSHPAITVTSVAIEPAADGAEATVRLSVAGHESSLRVPFTLEFSTGELRARGAFTVRQTSLGLTPLSVLLGTLRVEDALQVKFDLVAVAG
jgi:polyisoprenoid-binding protein YceI